MVELLCSWIFWLINLCFDVVVYVLLPPFAMNSFCSIQRKTSANAKDGKGNNDSNNHTDSNTNKSSHGRSHGKKSSSNKRARTIRQQPQEAKHPYEVLSNSANAGTSGSSSSSRGVGGITIAKKSGIKHQLNNFGATSSSLQNLNNSSSQISSINNPLVPDPMTSLDPVSIAKAAVGKGVTHQYSSSTNNSNHTQNLLTSNNTSNNKYCVCGGYLCTKTNSILTKSKN